MHQPEFRLWMLLPSQHFGKEVMEGVPQQSDKAVRDDTLPLSGLGLTL